MRCEYSRGFMEMEKKMVEDKILGNIQLVEGGKRVSLKKLIKKVEVEQKKWRNF